MAPVLNAGQFQAAVPQLSNAAVAALPVASLDTIAAQLQPAQIQNLPQGKVDLLQPASLGIIGGHLLPAQVQALPGAVVNSIPVGGPGLTALAPHLLAAQITALSVPQLNATVAQLNRGELDTAAGFFNQAQIVTLPQAVLVATAPNLNSIQLAGAAPLLPAADIRAMAPRLTNLQIPRLPQGILVQEAAFFNPLQFGLAAPNLNPGDLDAMAPNLANQHIQALAQPELVAAAPHFNIDELSIALPLMGKPHNEVSEIHIAAAPNANTGPAAGKTKSYNRVIGGLTALNAAAPNSGPQRGEINALLNPNGHKSITNLWTAQQGGGTIGRAGDLGALYERMRRAGANAQQQANLRLAHYHTVLATSNALLNLGPAGLNQAQFLGQGVRAQHLQHILDLADHLDATAQDADAQGHRDLANYMRQQALALRALHRQLLP